MTIDARDSDKRDPGGGPILVAGGRRIRVLQVVHERGADLVSDPGFVPVENPELTRFFESAIIAEAIRRGAHRDVDYFGVVSARFGAKIPMTGSEIAERMVADGFSSDCYSFFGRLERARIWPLAETKHPGITEAASMLFDRLALDADAAEIESPPIYQNHFLCRSPVYEQYAREMLWPALAAMRDASDAAFQAALDQDPHYADPRLSVSDLEAVFGRPRYTMHPFVCERLFSTWLGLHPEVRVHHVWNGRFVAPEAIRHEPEMDLTGARE